MIRKIPIDAELIKQMLLGQALYPLRQFHADALRAALEAPQPETADVAELLTVLERVVAAPPGSMHAEIRAELRAAVAKARSQS